MQDTISPDARRELAPAGTLRASINFGNPVLAQRDPATGEPRGVTADLSQELARRLGVPVEFVPFETAGLVADTAVSGQWTVGFLAIDPLRAETIEFTAPYVIIEGTYLVPSGSSVRTIDDVDRPGVRIAVGAKTAYDLFLSRSVKHAQLVRLPTSATALDTFVEDGLDAAAGIRQALAAFARSHAGLRVVGGQFMTIRQAMAVPKAHAAAAAYLCGFIEEMKASGAIATSLARSGQAEAAVAPAGA